MAEGRLWGTHNFKIRLQEHCLIFLMPTGHFQTHEEYLFPKKKDYLSLELLISKTRFPFFFLSLKEQAKCPIKFNGNRFFWKSFGGISRDIS
jgi:hypothetical protein